MLSSTSISQSGIKAATDMFSVSSNNLANINTDGFKKDVVRLKEAEGGGVDVNVSKSNNSSATFKSDEGKIVETSNVNQVEEGVNQIVAKHQFSANTTALKTSIETGNELLDILA